MSNPNAAAYPGALATDNTLLVARDESSSFLAAPVGISDLSVTLTDGTTFNTPCSLSIDTEILYSPSNIGNVFTVQRGFDGSTPSVHATGTAVFGNIIAWHHNQVSAEIKAIESTLGINLSNIPTGVPPSRLINTTVPLAGGGNLSADLTLSIATATSSSLGVVKPDNTTVSIAGGVLSAVNTGTVTSVTLTMPAVFSVSGSPVLSSGGFSVTLANELAHTVWAGPTTGAATPPTFRALVATDIPALAYAPTTRLINTTAPLAGGGDLSADRTLTIATATTSVLGVVKPDGTTITISGGVISSVATGSGTVTSVALTAPSEIAVAGSPITTSGTLALTWANESANTVFAGPTTGGSTTPTFRTLVAADIPLLAYAPTSRLINTTAPLAGGGNLGADLTLSVGTATTSVLGVVKPDGTSITISGGVISSVSGGAGTVTSVDMTVPGELAVTGVPIVVSGVIGLSWTSETANFVFAGPTTGAATTPTFRALVLADIPALPYVPTTRLINTTAPLAGGGALSSDLTLSVATATTSVLGVVKPDGTTISIATGVISAVNTGTVTSVTLTMPGIFSVGGSPVTSSGVLAVTLATEAANTVWAGPTTGAAATPVFRSLVAADIPALSYVPTARLINTTAPLAGGGDLSADLTLTVATATTSVLGVVKPDGTTITISAGVISTATSGTVTSVGLSLPSIFTVTVSPIINSGTLTAVLATQAANLVFAGPTTGAAATPTFRSLVVADIPSLSYVPTARLINTTAPLAGGGNLSADLTLTVGTATTSVLGVVKPDGTTISISSGVISAVNTGTVTSVGLSLPAIFTVTVSPVTASGTLTAVLATQSANLVWAGPATGAAATPTFRSLVNADMPGSGAGSGTVTSVSLSMPAIFSVGGSPVTASGTLAVTLATEAANTVWAGPTTGAATTPTFRSLVSADIPALSYVTSVSLTMPAIFSVSGSPISSSGTFGVTLATETANTVWAGPTTGAATTPTFRALVNADMPATGAGSGTVTSVALSAPSEITVGGSPITASGTLAITWTNESANRVFAGPTTGAATTPTFRALVAADIPALPYVPTARLINTTSPLAGGGDLSADRTLTVGTATTSVLGVVKPDGTTITIAAGVITAITSAGTVTRVDMTVPASLLSVSGAPITTSGTLAVTLATQTANAFFCGPLSGGPLVPTFRLIDWTDLPNATSTVRGIVKGDETTIQSSGTGVLSAVSTKPQITSTVSAAGTTTLITTSNPYQILTGTTTQSYVLPDATLLGPGVTFWFHDNSTGTLTLKDGGSNSIATLTGGTGAGVKVTLTNNSTTAGVWDIFYYTQSIAVANTVFAGATSGGTSVPQFRSLVAADLGTTLSPTFAGITVTSTGASITVTDAVTTTATTLASFLQSSLANGTRTSIFTGKAASTNNSSYIGHIPNVTANQSLLSLGQFGAPELMVIRGDGAVGIGTSSPGAFIHAVNNNILVDTLIMEAYGGIGSTGSPSILFRTSRGTSGSPSAVQANDQLNGIRASGYNGSAFSSRKASVLAFASENWTTSANGTYLTFETTANGTTTLTEAMRIDNLGMVTMVSGIRTAVTTFAGLPASPIAGQRGFISNGAGTTFAAAAAGGGANNVPVYYDGAAWRVG